MIEIVIAILVAENICLAAYWYFRPDRAARRAEREHIDLLKSAALKILNRGFGIQGAPAMDGEFDEPETPGPREYTADEIEQLGPVEAQQVLDDMEAEIAGEQRRRTPGIIAKRREMVGKAARLRARIEDGIPAKDLRFSNEPYIAPPLDSQDEAHLETLRPSN